MEPYCCIIVNVMDQRVIDFKNFLKESGKKGLAVDIDETLSETVIYWVTEMQKLFGNPENLTVAEMIIKYGHPKNVPHWQTEEAKEWREERKHSDEIHETLPLIEHADKSVKMINEIIPIVCYITARPDA